MLIARLGQLVLPSLRARSHPNGAGETPESEPPVSGSPGYHSAPPTPASETSGGQSVPLVVAAGGYC